MDEHLVDGVRRTKNVGHRPVASHGTVSRRRTRVCAVHLVPICLPRVLTDPILPLDRSVACSRIQRSCKLPFYTPSILTDRPFVLLLEQGSFSSYSTASIHPLSYTTTIGRTACPHFGLVSNGPASTCWSVSRRRLDVFRFARRTLAGHFGTHLQPRQGGFGSQPGTRASFLFIRFPSPLVRKQRTRTCCCLPGDVTSLVAALRRNGHARVARRSAPRTRRERSCDLRRTRATLDAARSACTRFRERHAPTLDDGGSCGSDVERNPHVARARFRMGSASCASWEPRRRAQASGRSRETSKRCEANARRRRRTHGDGNVDARLNVRARTCASSSSLSSNEAGRCRCVCDGCSSTCASTKRR